MNRRHLPMLELSRLRLRSLLQFVEGSARKPGHRQRGHLRGHLPGITPGTAFTRFRAKVEACLRRQIDRVALQRLRRNRPLPQEAFAHYLDHGRFSVGQIRFVTLIVEECTANGRMDPGRLYESPFTDHAPTGPDLLFSDSAVETSRRSSKRCGRTPAPAGPPELRCHQRHLTARAREPLM